MTPHAALSDLLARLAAQDSCAVHLGRDDFAQWPSEFVAAAKSARLLERARPASSSVCPGCERQCAMPVHVIPTTDGRPVRAFISCDKPEDMGRVTVKLSDLARWRITDQSLARALARLLGIPDPLQRDGSSRCWAMEPPPGHERGGALTLSLDGSPTLTAAGGSIALADLLRLDGGMLCVSEEFLLDLLQGEIRQPKSEVGSAEWRRQSARTAANARHDRPGGSREKQRKIREIWASGKYSTRDICAEEECAALDMSFSAARKALRNAPGPNRRT